MTFPILPFLLYTFLGIVVIGGFIAFIVWMSVAGGCCEKDVNYDNNGRIRSITNTTITEGIVGYAEFNTTIQHGILRAPGVAFPIDTQIYNTVPTAIVSSSGDGGTVFTLAAGAYVIDYEMSLVGPGAVAVYTGPDASSLVLDPNTVAGSTTPTTWIHGRAMEVVSTTLVFGISPVGAAAAVTTAGTDGTSFMTRLTILKIA
jgi:hypothetical protein